MANVIIIGTGNIGAELRRQLEDAGHVIAAQLSRNSHEMFKGLSTQNVCELLKNYIGKVDAALLAIPNGNKGFDELGYMTYFRDRFQIPVVTCAKAAHAYHYPEVLKLSAIGNSACVGGGSDILHALSRFQLAKQRLIVYAVINGTLNYIWSSVQAGNSFGAAVSAAKKMGYAEPGNDDHIAIVNGELDDICMKASIICNTALSDGSRFITPDDFHVWRLHASDIKFLTSRNARYRYIVTLASVDDPDEVEENTPGYVRAEFGNWRIVGGFHDVKVETPFYDWLREIDGVNNGFVIHNALSENTGQSAAGPGAGPEVTAAAMIRDLNRLLANK